MSQIKLLHSGGNGVSIVAPDSNPASDRTLKLPSDGDGTILTTNSSVGKILQVVQQIRTDTVSESSIGNGATGSTDVLTKAITPSSASSKVLVILNATLGMSNGPERLGMLLFVGGSVVDAARADAASNRGRASVFSSFPHDTSHATFVAHTFLHSPNTTSSTTYSYRFISGSGATTTMYLSLIHI